MLKEYSSRDFRIVVFPCNQFMNKEPGSNEAVKAWARSRKFEGVLMDKVLVNGKRASPVFNFLKVASGDTTPIPWPYTKWLVGRDGRVYGRYLPRTRPAMLEDSILRLLAEGAAGSPASPEAAPSTGSAAAAGAGAAAGVSAEGGGDVAVDPAGGVLAPQHGTTLGTFADAFKLALHRHRPEDELLPSQWPRRQQQQQEHDQQQQQQQADTIAGPAQPHLPVVTKAAGSASGA